MEISISPENKNNIGNLKVNIWGQLYFSLSTLLLLIIIILYVRMPGSKEISACSVALCIVFLIKFRKSIPFLLLFFYFTLYVYESTKYFYGGISIAVFKYFNSPEIINKVLLANSLFIYTLGNVIRIKVARQKFELDKLTFKSKYIYWTLVFICLVIIQFGIRGESLLSGGRYGAAEKSTLHEYYILFYFILLLVSPNKNKLYKVINFLLYATYSAKTLLYGGRVEVVQVTLLVCFLYWLVPKKMNKTLFLLLILIASYANMVVQNARNNPMNVLKGNYAQILKPSLFDASPQKKPLYLGTNQGDVLYAGSRLVGLVDHNVISSDMRIKSFLFFIASIVVPSGKVPSYAHPGQYMTNVYPSGGGGLLASYFYLWFGMSGPVFIGLFLGYFFNKGFLSNNVAIKIYTIILLIMSPRWYAYTPVTIFKYCFYTVFVYCLLHLVYSVFFKAVKPALGKNIS